MRNESLQGGDTTIFRLCQAACGSFTARRILHCARSTRACPRAEAALTSAGPSSPASWWVKLGTRTPLACPEEHTELLAVFKHSSVNPMQYSYPSRHGLVWGSTGAWDVGRDAQLIAWAKLGCRGASAASGAGLGLWNEFTREQQPPGHPTSAPWTQHGSLARLCRKHRATLVWKRAQSCQNTSQEEQVSANC